MLNIDVVALGELLVDFTPAGKNEQGVTLFARNPGGAPANVVVMNTKLGGKTAFIGKVGTDDFGAFLRKTLEESNIDVSGLVTDKRVHTTLAFVQLDEHGDRSFTFYRNPGADAMLSTEDVKLDLIDSCKIFHFGSVSLTEGLSRTATFDAVKYAKQNSKLISFDPNFRPLLWKSDDEAIEQIKKGVSMSDLLKVSEEEMTLLTGETDILIGSKKLLSEGPLLVLVSLGAKGSFYNNGKCNGYLPTYDVKTVDTTGAGDAFMGAIHYMLKDKASNELATLKKSELDEIVSFANAAGSLTTTKGGAITAMPSMEEIKQCLKDVPLFG